MSDDGTMTQRTCVTCKYWMTESDYGIQECSSFECLLVHYFRETWTKHEFLDLVRIGAVCEEYEDITGVDHE